MAKKTAPKNVLEPLHVKLSEKPVKTGDVMKVLVSDNYPTRYNTASSISKQADKLMSEMKPAMAPDAVKRLIAENVVHPWEPIASVAYQDPEGNVTRVSFTSKYKEVPAKIAEDLFNGLRCRPREGEKDGATADINDYMQRTVVGTFNSESFLDEDGRFDKNRYDKIMAALDKVSRELGIQNPLSTVETVKPLPTFHARRWVDFDSETNEKITRMLPNQLVFSPCPNVITGKMVGEEDEAEGDKKP